VVFGIAAVVPPWSLVVTNVWKKWRVDVTRMECGRLVRRAIAKIRGNDATHTCPIHDGIFSRMQEGTCLCEVRRRGTR
jgi:hypothetical protein